MTVKILHGDCRDVLRTLSAESVHCVVTSPPYWGLRDYGTAKWEGGASAGGEMYACEDCGVIEHISKLTAGCPKCGQTMVPYVCDHSVGGQVQDSKAPGAITTGQRPGVDASSCKKCGASRIDSQIGLESSIDDYVAVMVEVFREVRRVLRKDGTCWVNLGDSYAANGVSGLNVKGVTSTLVGTANSAHYSGAKSVPAGLKPKDLCGVPWRVAFALQADGWYLRSDIIWEKPNPMPESVTDRPTKAHEYLFLLSKSPTYFYDAEAIKEESIYKAGEGGHQRFGAPGGKAEIEYGRQVSGQIWNSNGTRNRRTVWEIATSPFPEAHFATFPPALVEPCIKAGCPEKVCARCGAPWVRESAREEQPKAYPDRKYDRSDPKFATKRNLGARYQAELDANPKITLGFSPSCSCSPKNTRGPVYSGTVLDPFGGAGTTGLVADRLGRNAVLIELNPDYAAMARKRIEGDAGLFAQVAAE